MKFKIFVLSGLLSGMLYASGNFSYDIYLKFNLNNNNNIAKRYNKIVSDTISIIKKAGNPENKCQFQMKETNIFLNCNNLTKNTIPLMNNYVNNNILNQQDLLEYKIIRKDQQLLPTIKRESQNLITKIKSFFK